jgi:hypothetical protein
MFMMSGCTKADFVSQIRINHASEGIAKIVARNFAGHVDLAPASSTLG